MNNSRNSNTNTNTNNNMSGHRSNKKHRHDQQQQPPPQSSRRRQTSIEEQQHHQRRRYAPQPHYDQGDEQELGEEVDNDDDDDDALAAAAIADGVSGDDVDADDPNLIARLGVGRTQQRLVQIETSIGDKQRKQQALTALRQRLAQKASFGASDQSAIDTDIRMLDVDIQHLTAYHEATRTKLDDIMQVLHQIQERERELTEFDLENDGILLQMPQLRAYFVDQHVALIRTLRNLVASLEHDIEADGATLADVPQQYGASPMPMMSELILPPQ